MKLSDKTYIESSKSILTYMMENGKNEEIISSRFMNDNGNPTINSLLFIEMEDEVTVAFIPASYVGNNVKVNKRVWVLPNQIKEFKQSFSRLCDEDCPERLILKFSNTINDNIFITSKIKKQ